MKVDQKIVEILSLCRVQDNTVILPDGQLDRATYLAVDKVLTFMGGKWNRKTKGHLFDHDPSDDLDNVILAGEVSNHKKDFQFFPTPKAVAERVCDLAEITSECNCLEPSCGKGNIADEMWSRNPHMLLGLELDIIHKECLDQKPYLTTVGVNFLTHDLDLLFDRICQNPPFAHLQDVDHVYKAYSVLAPGGILVSVMSMAPFYRSDKKSQLFRTWLDEVGAEVENLPEGAFKESGTMVKTCIVKIRKPAQNNVKST